VGTGGNNLGWWGKVENAVPSYIGGEQIPYAKSGHIGDLQREQESMKRNSFARITKRGGKQFMAICTPKGERQERRGADVGVE